MAVCLNKETMIPLQCKRITHLIPLVNNYISFATLRFYNKLPGKVELALQSLRCLIYYVIQSQSQVVLSNANGKLSSWPCIGRGIFRYIRGCPIQSSSIIHSFVHIYILFAEWRPFQSKSILAAPKRQWTEMNQYQRPHSVRST